MKGVSGALLALIFVFFSLLSLISVNPTWEESFVTVIDNQSRVSELGLRFALQK
jgi:hypothetical protein